MREILLYKNQIMAIIPCEDNSVEGASLLNWLLEKNQLVINESGIIRSLIYYLSTKRGMIVFATSRSVDYLLKRDQMANYIKVRI